MKIRDYLYFNGFTITSFAQAVGCSRNYLNLIVNGKLRPSLRMARLISDETGGEVSVSEIRGEVIKENNLMSDIFGED